MTFWKQFQTIVAMLVSACKCLLAARLRGGLTDNRAPAVCSRVTLVLWSVRGVSRVCSRRGSQRLQMQACIWRVDIEAIQQAVTASQSDAGSACMQKPPEGAASTACEPCESTLSWPEQTGLHLQCESTLARLQMRDRLCSGQDRAPGSHAARSIVQVPLLNGSTGEREMPYLGAELGACIQAVLLQLASGIQRTHCVDHVQLAGVGLHPHLVQRRCRPLPLGRSKATTAQLITRCV